MFRPESKAKDKRPVSQTAFAPDNKKLNSNDESQSKDFSQINELNENLTGDNIAINDTNSSQLNESVYENIEEVILKKEEIVDKGTKRSWIWKHFKLFNETSRDVNGNEKVLKKAYCNFKECGHSYIYSGSSMGCNDHLKKQHKLNDNSIRTNSDLPQADKTQENKFNYLLLMFIAKRLYFKKWIRLKKKNKK